MLFNRLCLVFLSLAGASLAQQAGQPGAMPNPGAQQTHQPGYNPLYYGGDPMMGGGMGGFGGMGMGQNPLMMFMMMQMMSQQQAQQSEMMMPFMIMQMMQSHQPRPQMQMGGGMN